MSTEASLPDVFERQVHAGPDRIAIGDGAHSLTYGALNRWSNRIAHAVLALTGDGQEPVGLLFRQSAEAVAATLGVLKAGKICLPIDPGQPHLGRVIADVKPRLIVTNSEYDARGCALMGAPDKCLEIAAASNAMPERNPGLDLGPASLSYIFYTSGTTGVPKGVFDDHRNVLHNIMRYTDSLGIDASDRLSLIQSINFSGSVSSLFSALLTGAAVCPFDLAGHGIGRMADWLEDQKITIFHSVPTIFEQVLARRHRFDNLRIVRLEGDRVEPHHIALFQQHFSGDQRLVNGFGTTETGLIRQFFVAPDDRVDGPVVPIGHAVDGVDITLTGQDGHGVAPGSVGEIVVHSPYLARQLSDASFPLDPAAGRRRRYATGDLGRMGSDGLLYCLGRKDFQAKLRGQWIDTAAIEHALLGVGSITRALVMTRDDRMGTQQLVAYVLAAGDPPPIDTLRQALGRSLPAIMVPSRFVFMAAYPLDQNGKVDRRAFPAPSATRPPLAQAYVAPEGKEAEIVAACFCRVLHLDRVGIHDDFLDLGGDSLLAAELLLTLEADLGVACSPSLISSSFSVASMTARIQQTLPESTLIPIQAGTGPPLFCIHSYEGNILEYYRLLRHLGPDQSVYGLQSRAYSKDRIFDTSVTEMAAAYVAEITALGAPGPIHLCGSCFGGVVAFEMACQLRRQGYDVGLLALIDTEFPGGLFTTLMVKITSPTRWHRFRELSAYHRFWFLVAGSLRFARWLAAKVWRIFAPLGGGPPAGHTAQAAPANNRFLGVALAAMANYRPQRYPGSMALICLGSPHNQRGWIKLAKHGCRVIELARQTPADGTRRPHLTSAPYLAPLAEQLARLLAPFK